MSAISVYVTSQLDDLLEFSVNYWAQFEETGEGKEAKVGVLTEKSGR